MWLLDPFYSWNAIHHILVKCPIFFKCHKHIHDMVTANYIFIFEQSQIHGVQGLLNMHLRHLMRQHSCFSAQQIYKLLQLHSIPVRLIKSVFPLTDHQEYNGSSCQNKMSCHFQPKNHIESTWNLLPFPCKNSWKSQTSTLSQLV